MKFYNREKEIAELTRIQELGIRSKLPNGSADRA